MSLVESAALSAQREPKERERKWCIAMVIRFTEQVSVLQWLELHDWSVLFRRKNSVLLHKQSSKMKRLSSNV